MGAGGCGGLTAGGDGGVAREGERVATGGAGLGGVTVATGRVGLGGVAGFGASSFFSKVRASSGGLGFPGFGGAKNGVTSGTCAPGMAVTRPSLTRKPSAVTMVIASTGHTIAHFSHPTQFSSMITALRDV